MLTEDYVSFETAKLLKEKWFDSPTNTGYNKDGYTIERAYNDGERSIYGDSYNWNKVEIYYSRPTLWEAMKWLREVHGFFIHIDVIREASCWLVDIQDIKGDVSVYPIKKEFPNYEEACEAAIKYCLENLI